MSLGLLEGSGTEVVVSSSPSSLETADSSELSAKIALNKSSDGLDA